MIKWKYKCKLCGRKHGSGGCYRQRALRKKLRHKFPSMSKSAIAKMARDHLLKKWKPEIADKATGE